MVMILMSARERKLKLVPTATVITRNTDEVLQSTDCSHTGADDGGNMTVY